MIDRHFEQQDNTPSYAIESEGASRQDDAFARAQTVLAVGGGLAGIVFVLRQQAPFVYDEWYHLVRAYRLAVEPSFVTWLCTNTTSAPGPVYALLHYALSGGRGALAAPFVRLPNLLLTIGIAVALVKHLRQMKFTHAGARAALLLAVPVTWTVAGMALTEVPAIAAIAVAVLAAQHISDASTRLARMLGAAVLALGVALSICGRQPYLLVIPSLFWIAARDRSRAGIAGLGIVVGLIPATLLFTLWGGLLPPAFAVHTGLRPFHAVLALAYCAAYTLLIAPRLMIVRWRPVLGAAMVGALLGAAAGASFVPFRSLLVRISSLERPLRQASAAAVASLAAGFTLAVLFDAWHRRHDRAAVAHAGSVLVLCFVCSTVTFGFSARYVAMALPFLIWFVAPHVRFGWPGIVRFVTGMLVGAQALSAYYALDWAAIQPETTHPLP